MNWQVHFIWVAILLATYYVSTEAQQVKCLPDQPQCCDRNQFCTFWSQRGECNRNPNWMLFNCQISCNACNRPGLSRDLVTPAPRPTFAPRPVISPPTQMPLRDPSAPEGCSVVQPMEVFFAPVLNIGAFQTSFARTGCGTVTQVRDCNRNMCYHKKFRSLDGMCNNLQNPALGAAFTGNARFLSSQYDDGFNAVCASLKRDRPNPRQVSVSLLSSPHSLPLNASSLLMQWAQFLAHDMSQNALAGPCTCSGGPGCANMPAAAGDPMRLQCTGYSRSIPVCGTGVRGRPREQMNQNSAFIDGSAVYGSDFSTSRSLRSGHLLRFVGDFNRQMLPATGNFVMGGDARTGIFAGLHALQTYFLRFHNTVATELSKLNPRWNQDRVFEEARMIVGAAIQVITYQEFLPVFLGSSMGRIGGYSGYQPSVDPSILNEFSGAAFRLHGLIENSISMRDASYRPVGTLTFGQGISQNVGLVSSNMDFITRGLVSTPARSPQRLANTVADSFFNLATMTTQRGRDHGFQSYNAYRRQCGQRTISSFDSWPEVTDPNVINRVKQLYPGGVDTLDLYVGGLLERPQGGAVVGPTFTCIIAEQFKRSRNGDRFFFESPDVFTNEQRIALRRVTVSWVICSHSDSVNSITRTGFIADTGISAVACNSLQRLDLTPWRE